MNGDLSVAIKQSANVFAMFRWSSNFRTLVADKISFANGEGVAASISRSYYCCMSGGDDLVKHLPLACDKDTV